LLVKENIKNMTRNVAVEHFEIPKCIREDSRMPSSSYLTLKNSKPHPFLLASPIPISSIVKEYVRVKTCSYL
jgi:hypothetical protein